MVTNHLISYDLVSSPSFGSVRYIYGIDPIWDDRSNNIRKILKKINENSKGNTTRPY